MSYLFQALSVFALLIAFGIGMTAIYHDLESGAAVSIFSKPVSRFAFTIGKLAAAVAGLIVIVGLLAVEARLIMFLFGGGLEGVNEATFNDVVGEVPSKQIEGKDYPLIELLVLSGLCPSKGQARKDLEGGGIYLNNIRENDLQRVVSAKDSLFGKHLLLRKGRRNYVVLSLAKTGAHHAT